MLNADSFKDKMDFNKTKVERSTRKDGQQMLHIR